MSVGNVWSGRNRSLLRERYQRHLLYRAERVWPGAVGGVENGESVFLILDLRIANSFFCVESHGRVADSLRELPLVLANVYHSILQQDRCVQEQACQGNSSLSFLVALGADYTSSSLLCKFHSENIYQNIPLDPISTKPYYDISCRSTRRDSAYTRSKPYRLFVIIAVLTRVLILTVSRATDIRLVFVAVKETILQNALKDSGMLRAGASVGSLWLLVDFHSLT